MENVLVFWLCFPTSTGFIWSGLTLNGLLDRYIFCIVVSDTAEESLRRARYRQTFMSFGFSVLNISISFFNAGSEYFFCENSIPRIIICLVSDRSCCFILATLLREGRLYYVDYVISVAFGVLTFIEFIDYRISADYNCVSILSV